MDTSVWAPPEWHRSSDHWADPGDRQGSVAKTAELSEGVLSRRHLGRGPRDTRDGTALYVGGGGEPYDVSMPIEDHTPNHVWGPVILSDLTRWANHGVAKPEVSAASLSGQSQF